MLQEPWGSRVAEGRSVRHLVGALALLLSACGDAPDTARAQGAIADSVTTTPLVDPAYAERVSEIARSYTELTRLQDAASLGPLFCDRPVFLDRPLVSRSRDAESHGRKLYFLWVADVAAYRAASAGEQPIGQVLVKESFEAVPIEPEHEEFAALQEFGEAVEIDGARWKLGAPSDLFVMWKLAPETPGTDAGWVYATTSREGEVSSAGRVAACMECHVDAAHDRMFGAQAMHEVARDGSEAWELLMNRRIQGLADEE